MRLGRAHTLVDSASGFKGVILGPERLPLLCHWLWTVWRTEDVKDTTAEIVGGFCRAAVRKQFGLQSGRTHRRRCRLVPVSSDETIEQQLEGK